MSRVFCVNPLAAMAISVVLAASAAQAQTTWYVDDDADPNGVGMTWAGAFDDLQAALSVAAAGDEIRVAGGRYVPSERTEPNDPRTATFQLLSGVGLYGGYAGLADPNNPDDRNIALYESTPTGDLAGDDVPGDPNFVGNGENAYHVVTASGTDNTAVLDGFTITGGNADVSGRGGGMLSLDGSPSVFNCLFVMNAAGTVGGPPGRGAGIAYFGTDSSPVVSNCTFHKNKATDVYGLGGGIYYGGQGSPVVTTCLFTENSWGGMLILGARGGMVSSCEFKANNGTALILSVTNTIVTDCTFTGNSTAWFGGGMQVTSVAEWGIPAIANCTFVGNSAASHGGGVTFKGPGSTRVTNCSFVGNAAANGNALSTSSSAGGYELENCILWNGGNEVAITDESTITMRYCNVSGGWPGDGNIDADPLFVDPDGPDDDPNTYEDNDYRLAAGSPCIDAGSNMAVPPDVADLDGDGDLSEPTPFDLDGEGRFFDDPNTPDSGCGFAPVVDMGAYEFGGTGPQPCRGDLTGDRNIDLSDLGVLLVDFGCSGGCCVGDTNGDDVTDLTDLGNLLLDFGTTCP